MKAVKKEKSNNESIDFKKELWEAAVNLRGAIEPSDYKRFVLPLIFLRYLNTGYIKTYNELDGLTRNKKSDYYCETDKERKREKEILEGKARDILEGREKKEGGEGGTQQISVEIEDKMQIYPLRSGHYGTSRNHQGIKAWSHRCTHWCQSSQRRTRHARGLPCSHIRCRQRRIFEK